MSRERRSAEANYGSDDDGNDAGEEDDEEKEEEEERRGGRASTKAQLPRPHPRQPAAPLHPLQQPLHSIQEPDPSVSPPPPPCITSPDTEALAHRLYSLSLSCIGPRAHPKLIHLHPRSPHVTLTTASSRLLSPSSSLPLSQPVASLLSHALSATSSSDAGQLCLALSCRLIAQAASPSAPHIAIVAHAHGLALNCLLSFLTPPASSSPHHSSLSLPAPIAVLSLSSLPAVLAVTRSILHSKPVASLSSASCSHLSILIMEIFIRCQAASSVLRHLHCVGPEPAASFLCQGAVLDGPLPASFRSAAAGSEPELHRVLCYDINLTFDVSEQAADGSVETVNEDDGGWSASAAVEAVMERLVASWHQLAVTLILCQKAVHPLLQMLAAEAGIAVIDSLSLRHIAAVQAVAASPLISSLSSPLLPEHVGSCRVTQNVIAGKTRTVLSPASSSSPAQSAVWTLVLCHRTEQQLNELRVVVDQAVATLFDCAREEGELTVCAGGGVTEEEMAAALRQWSSERKARVQTAAQRRRTAGRMEEETQQAVEWRRLVEVERGVTQVVEGVAAALHDIGRRVRGKGGRQVEMEAGEEEEEEEEWKRSESGETVWRCVGWDGQMRCCWRQRGVAVTVDEETVMDSVLCKRRALQRAVELAAVVSRLHSVIRSNT